MSEHTGYLCHDCGNMLERVEGSKMWRCTRCNARRRTPAHPAFMTAWRWELTLAQRALAHAHRATPPRV